MRLIAFTTLLTASGCLAQPTAAPPATEASAITLPAGTKVPLRLTGPLGTRTAQAGDAVRAEVAFPVTTSNAVAIPTGTYFEGAIDKVTRRGTHAGFKMHFVRMVFANGYTVTLPAATADTRAGLTRTGDPLAAAAGGSDVPAGGMAFQSLPAPTLPPMLKPKVGLAIGIAAGTIGAGVVAAVTLGRRGVEQNLAAGWQFEMVLASPLSLDADKVAAAVAITSAR